MSRKDLKSEIIGCRKFSNWSTMADEQQTVSSKLIDENGDYMNSCCNCQYAIMKNLEFSTANKIDTEIKKAELEIET